MTRTLIRTVDPTDEPVTLAQVRAQTRIDDTLEDDLLSDAIATARDYAEGVTWMPLMTQTWQLGLSGFRELIELKPNLQSVTSVTYIDTNGDEQTVDAADYLVDTAAPVGAICPAYGKSWPSARNQRNSVKVTFVCGFASADKVPAKIKQALLMLVTHWWNNREAVTVGAAMAETPIGVRQLLLNSRVR